MKTLLAAAGLSLMAIAPASAVECVMNGDFVPCPGRGAYGVELQQGIGYGDEMVESRTMVRPGYGRRVVRGGYEGRMAPGYGGPMVRGGTVEVDQDDEF
jgi:hypothetical protein